jgi:hypothetical protein
VQEFAGGGFGQRHDVGFLLACMAGFGGAALCCAAVDGERNTMG